MISEFVQKRAKRETATGQRILVTPTEVVDMMIGMDKVLDGDGDETERYVLRITLEKLSEIFEDPNRRMD